MGINTLTNLSTQEITASAGASITSGDLLVNTESGSIFGASNALTIAQNNNTTAGASAITAVTAGPNTYGYQDAYPQKNIAQLTNGTICYAYTGNGTSNTTGVSLQYKTMNGGNNVATISVTTNSSLYFPVVRALPNGGVVVAYTDGSASTFRYAIYTSAGATTKAVTTVGTVLDSPSQGSYQAMQVLTGGNIVFAYRRSGGMYIAIVDSSGTNVLTESLVEASSNPDPVVIRPQSGGGFILFYRRTAATAAWKFGRYNSSGTLQGSLTNISTGGNATSLSGGDPDNFCTELSNGNLLFMTADSTNYPRFSIYDSSGTSVKSATSIFNNTGLDTSTYLRQNRIPGVCVFANGGFAFVTNGSSRFYTTTYDNTGGQLIGATQTSQSTSGTSDQYWLQLFDMGSNFAIFSYNYLSGCSTTYYVYLFVSNKTTGTTAGSLVNLNSSISSLVVYQPGAVLTSDGSIALTFTDGTPKVWWGTYAIQRKSIIGVAQSTASTGGTVRIGTLGTYTVNNSYATGGAFDQRTATVPGAKGIVAGTTAVMFGLS